MGNFKFNNLDKYRIGGTDEEMLLSLPFPKSASGKVYRQSPNEDASPRLFLIGDASSNRLISPQNSTKTQLILESENMICPYSGFIAHQREFIHPRDIEDCQAEVERAIKEDAFSAIEQMLSDAFGGFKPTSSNKSGITITITSKPSNRIKSQPLNPIREDLLRNLCCHVCTRHYGVYAVALFCPDCGAANLALHFEREMEIVQHQVKIAEQENNPEIRHRLIANAHEDVVTAFETTLKTVYKYFIRKKYPNDYEVLEKKIGNSFQNLEKSTQKFKDLSIELLDLLTEADYQCLFLNIQKRHIIGHNLSIADEKYIALDQNKQTGEIIPITSDEIEQFYLVCHKVIKEIELPLLDTARNNQL